MATSADAARRAGAGTRRRWLMAVLALALLALWSFGIEPRWVARRELAHHVPQWNRPPLKVAVASDWHFSRHGAWRVMTLERARRIVDEINAAAPDVILLPGDFIAEPETRPPGAPTAQDEIAAVLGRLRAPLGVYAVLGNHDWWHDGPGFAAALERRGIRVLDNQARAIDAGLWVVGVGDHSTGHSRPREALARVPGNAHALVMMHDPASFYDLPPVAGLAVAAHTHGGQVSVPFFGAPIVPGAAPRQWAYGWVAHQGRPLYVTSGLGVSILPVRFNMRPEWVLFTLDAAAG